MITKLIGISLLIIATSLMGISMSKAVGDKVKRIELLHGMLDELTTQMRFRRLTVYELIDFLADSNMFERLSFLKIIKSDIKPGMPFYPVWEKGVDEDGSLSREESEFLKMLGSTLGCSDLDGQLSSLEVAESRLNLLLEDARKDYAQKARLYRSMGFLSGVFISIMII